jgi:[acyl-carrier-protein] S-malonyltransferase
MSAGHSLGEYTALYAAGILAFEDALGIIQERAMGMEGAQTHGTCGMAAVIGLTRERCEELVQDARGSEVLCLANLNAPDQIVVSGHLPAIHRVMEVMNKEKRARAVLLNVSSAFHTPLMEPALTKLRMIVDATPISKAAFPVVANVDAKPYPSQSEAIRQRLVSQVVNPVLWEDSVRYMVSQGVSTFVELGPGKVLTGLVRRIDKSVRTTNLSSVSTCQLFAEEWQ